MKTTIVHPGQHAGSGVPAGPGYHCVFCGEAMSVVARTPATPTSKPSAYGYCATCKRTEYAERYEPALADPTQAPMRRDCPSAVSDTDDEDDYYWDCLSEAQQDAEAEAERRAEEAMEIACGRGYSVVLT